MELTEGIAIDDAEGIIDDMLISEAIMLAEGMLISEVIMLAEGMLMLMEVSPPVGPGYCIDNQGAGNAQRCMPTVTLPPSSRVWMFMSACWKFIKTACMPVV